MKNLSIRVGFTVDDTANYSLSPIYNLQLKKVIKMMLELGCAPPNICDLQKNLSAKGAEGAMWALEISDKAKAQLLPHMQALDELHQDFLGYIISDIIFPYFEYIETPDYGELIECEEVKIQLK